MISAGEHKFKKMICQVLSFTQFAFGMPVLHDSHCSSQAKFKVNCFQFKKLASKQATFDLK